MRTLLNINHFEETLTEKDNIMIRGESKDEQYFIICETHLQNHFAKPEVFTIVENLMSKLSKGSDPLWNEYKSIWNYYCKSKLQQSSVIIQAKPSNTRDGNPQNDPNYSKLINTDPQPFPPTKPANISDEEDIFSAYC